MKTLIMVCGIAALLMLNGCASSDYGEYVKAQSDANRLAVESQKPMVRITAQPGQPITGLASLEVYAPTAAPVIQQSRPNEWAGVLGHGIGVAGSVLGIKYAGEAATSLADSVGRSSNAGYQYIQAPAANVSTVTTTTDSSNRAVTTDSSNHAVTTSTTVGDNSGSNSGNSGRIAGADLSDSTSVPTVVTQPEPVVVTQPEPVVVTQPAPVVVPQSLP